MLVGNDPASATYVASKARACQQVGIDRLTLNLPATISQTELLEKVRGLVLDDSVDGILVQLPLPEHLADRAVLDAIDPAKDVDGFHAINVGRLWRGEPTLAPATPSGILELLRRSQIPLQGRRAVIVGRSNIVGKPMAALLLAEHATVTVCHSRTPDLAAVCREAEILVVAVGRAGLVGPEHVGDGAVVIDVGMNRVTDNSELTRLFPSDEERRASFEQRGYVLAGDVDYHRVASKTSAITPVPGGVGPLTVAMLLVNTLKASCQRQGLER